jgi:type VI secretion system protein ImpA
MPLTLDIAPLLEPVPGPDVCGQDLRFSMEWRKLEDARRADDDLNQGPWVAKEQKNADWNGILARGQELLATKTKDIRLAVKILEAAIHKDGFAGAATGLRLLHDLVQKFWDDGLYPQPVGGDYDDRAAAFDWINTKLPDLLRGITITARTDGGDDYDFARYLDAREIGRERDYEEGKVSAEKRERFLAARNEGRCLDLYDTAMAATPLEPVESLLTDVQEARSALGDLSRLLKEKFPSEEAAPGFTEVRETLDEIENLLDTTVRNKRPAVQPQAAAAAAAAGSSGVPGFGAPASFTGLSGAPASGDWSQAEVLIRSGKVEQGLLEMTRLAQRETSGRARFHRKLLLADVCLGMNRDRLARTVLEELAEQIETHKLAEWETTDVVGAVWTRLHKIYKKGGEGEKASQLYLKLCRLDPWQTLGCSDE